jgi:hypothetical protein
MGAPCDCASADMWAYVSHPACDGRKIVVKGKGYRVLVFATRAGGKVMRLKNEVNQLVT